MNAANGLVAGPPESFEKRKSVFPKAVDGTFRRLKWAVMAFALAVYYITPWIRWDRGPYAPYQAVLIDLANRRFYMFSIEIWPHEFYYVTGLLIMAGIGLFLVTSAVGRAWCGYACPQTVWTDLFQHVERFVDGDRNAQIRLQKSSWNFTKLRKRLSKWAIWLFIAFWTGGAWIMYFADAPTLTVDFWSGNAAFVAYGTVAFLTATTFIFGGFMREQVCIYMCPWPRIQTAMMDENSLTVTYKEDRGEPRSLGIKKALAQPDAFGDCIDCNQCVAVCPTGIDIREGPQIGCITCALCIDACDKVMEQVGRPRGLIDYATLDDAEHDKAHEAHKPILKTLFRPRTILYFSAWGAVGLAMLFAVGTRSRLDLSALQDRNPLYVQLSDGSVRNNYTIKIRDMQSRPRDFEIGMVGLDGAVMWTNAGNRKSAGQKIQASVSADTVSKIRVFIAASGEGPQKQQFDFSIRALDKEGSSDSEDAFFERPGS